jgi:hypothetical protein
MLLTRGPSALRCRAAASAIGSRNYNCQLFLAGSSEGKNHARDSYSHHPATEP